MANIKSAIKRIKVAEFKTRRNKMIISSLKTSIKKFEDSVKGGNLEEAQNLYRKAVSMIDKAAAKGSLHKNTAARKKSRLSNKLKAAM
ncbi:30S ribosomal protein S20 [Lutispora sp.]|uniref:30S ribosomal protein S20 n=1 Tax=Lutispora sp. TaxID=2828727 RepID=UPI000EDEFF0F|nr:30S ribosomal protein S20 [Lutispora sp.]MEA4960361.1 30S ribosomal protein S20 [Lutispora sp.]HCJ57132.1 30S ribosomal protein S20 [Clostridiaceae bacterium]